MHSPTDVNLNGIRTQILYDEKKKENFMKMFILKTKFKSNMEYCIGFSINQMPCIYFNAYQSQQEVGNCIIKFYLRKYFCSA